MKKACLLLCLMAWISAVGCTAVASAELIPNITGVSTWGSAKQNRMPAPGGDFPRQDADFPKTFSFTKLDASGTVLPDESASWSCVRDNSSGLIWEVKTSGGGLHGNSHTYTWFNSDIKNSSSEGTEGDPGDTTCGNPISVAEGCDTEKFISAVNATGWCGHKDWRLPSVNELGSIVNYGTSLPAISKKYFPDLIMPAGFWTASPYAANPNFAWIVIFDDGYLGSCVKSWPYYVRLVRGGI